MSSVSARGLKESLVRYAHVMAILGLVAVGAAVLTAVLLVTSAYRLCAWRCSE